MKIELEHRRGSGLRKARCVMKCHRRGGTLRGCRKKCGVKKK